MTKTRKSLIALFSVLFMICVGLFTLTACGGSKKALDSIRISKQPTKKAYVIGETFDPAGLEVTATYQKGDKKESKVLETGAYTVTPDATYIDASTGKFKLAAGTTSASVKVTVSYTENKVEKTANTSVSLTKPVKSVTIATMPETLTYYAGQPFDSKGLTIDVVYEDDSEEKGIAIVTSGENKNCDIDIAGAIPSGTTQVVLTFGGKEIVIQIELIRGVWIEGETGLLNGKFPNQKPTTSSGNLGMDAALPNAQEGAQKFFESQLKADFALEQLKTDPTFDEDALKGVPSDRIKVNNKAIEVEAGGEVVDKLYDAICDWIASATAETTDKNYNEANATALKAYVESEEYEAEVEAYLASEEYEAEVARLRANNDIYLGGVGQGDTVSFVFSSTGAGTGSIAFKLASAYLCKDNGNWGPVVMGDIQLNRLAEVYINGVQYNIPDSVVLEGGKSPDGTANQALWVNWQEVGLDDIAFVEGRNVIEMKVLKHGITAPAQTSYSWSCNVDSMIILPNAEGEADFELETFDNEHFNYETVIKKVEFVENEGVANLVISGKLDFGGTKGYLNDILDTEFVNISVGKTGNSNLSLWAEVETVTNEDFTFVATSDISRLALTEEGKAGHSLTITVEEEPYDLSKINLPEPLKVAHNTYAFNENYEITVTCDASIKFTSIALEAGADDEAGKVFVILTGEYTAYTAEELAEIVLDMEGANGRVVVGVPEVTVSTRPVTPDEGEEPAPTAEGEEPVEPEVVNVFTMKFDISDASKFPGTTAGQFYYMHAGMASVPSNLPESDAVIVEGKDTVTVGSLSYTLEAQHEVRGITIKDARGVKATPVAPDIRVENGKAVYVVKGTYTANAAAANDEEFIRTTLAGIAINFQHNQQAGGPNWDTVQLGSRLIEVVVDLGAKTYEAKYDVTSMTNSFYTGHYNGDDFKPTNAMDKTVYLDGHSYQIVVYPGNGDGNKFWGCVGLIIADTDQPNTPEEGTTPPVVDPDEGEDPVTPPVEGGEETDPVE